MKKYLVSGWKLVHLKSIMALSVKVSVFFPEVISRSRALVDTIWQACLEIRRGYDRRR